jgi:hypothetical protein
MLIPITYDFEPFHSMLIHYPMSHLYTLSVLYTLLGRYSLRHMLQEGSGTLDSDFQSSFLTAGVLSVVRTLNPFVYSCPHAYSPTYRLLWTIASMARYLDYEAMHQIPPHSMIICPHSDHYGGRATHKSLPQAH